MGDTNHTDRRSESFFVTRATSASMTSTAMATSTASKKSATSTTSTSTTMATSSTPMATSSHEHDDGHEHYHGDNHIGGHDDQAYWKAQRQPAGERGAEGYAIVGSAMVPAAPEPAFPSKSGLQGGTRRTIPLECCSGTCTCVRHAGVRGGRGACRGCGALHRGVVWCAIRGYYTKSQRRAVAALRCRCQCAPNCDGAPEEFGVLLPTWQNPGAMAKRTSERGVVCS